MGGARRVEREGREWGVTVNGQYRYGVIEERVGFCESAVYGKWRRASERRRRFRTKRVNNLETQVRLIVSPQESVVPAI